MIEQLRAVANGQTPVTALAKMLGMRLTAVEPGEAVIEIQTGPEHANLFGGVHGGVLCSLVDSAMGLAHASTLEPGETFTTIDLQIGFVRGVKIALLRARGRVIRRGRNVSFVESEVHDEAGRLIAKATCTCLTIRHHAHAPHARKGSTEAV